MDELGCKDPGQEAAFEAIRRSLPGRDGKDLDKRCNTTAINCTLAWDTKETAQIIILATDEDSDLPTSQTYFVGNQSRQNSFRAIEPSFSPFERRPFRGNGDNIHYRTGSSLTITKPFQDELEVTANEILKTGVVVHALFSLLVSTEFFQLSVSVSKDIPYNGKLYGNFWINSHVKQNSSFPVDDLSLVTLQFGDFRFAAQESDYSKFNRTLTLRNLVQRGLATSLQSRVLAGGGFMRTFNILDFVSTTDKSIQGKIIDSFYNELVAFAEYVQNTCVFIPDPAINITIAVAPTATKNVENPSLGFTNTPTQTSTQSSDGDEDEGFVDNEPTFSPAATISDPKNGENGSDDGVVTKDGPNDENDGNFNDKNNGDDDKVSRNTYIISGAIGFGLVAVAAVLFIYGKRNHRRVRDLHQILDAVEVATSNNPLYSTRFGFQNNPLFEKKHSLMSELTDVNVHPSDGLQELRVSEESV